jgi:MtaA/CmuA family methyltransferase
VNAYQRTQARLKGQAVDRPPNFDIFMTFAAHHAGLPLSRYYQDYHALVQANLVVLHDFDLDILQAISDPYREAADFGLQVSFPPDGLPLSQVPLLVETGDLADLHPPDPASGKRMGDRLEAIRLFRQEAGGQVPIMGWVEGALAEAADLRGVSNLMRDLIDRPDWVEALLETCVEVEIAFARAQVAAGADIIGLGDAVASQISPRMYRRFGLPYEQRIFAAVQEAGAIPRLHICGDSSRIVADMVESGAQIVDLDWMVDMQAAAQAYGERVSFCGNFDPVAVMLQGSPQAVYQATRACLRAGGPRGFSAAGCEIPDGTPHANLYAQARALREAGAGEQPAD